jgi:pyruvate, water dikinase
MSAGAPTFIRWFGDIRLTDVPLVGGKNASLGELYSRLSSADVRVRNDFAVTADWYRNALALPRLTEQLHQLLDGIDKCNITQRVRDAERSAGIQDRPRRLT